MDGDLLAVHKTQDVRNGKVVLAHVFLMTKLPLSA